MYTFHAKMSEQREKRNLPPSTHESEIGKTYSGQANLHNMKEHCWNSFFPKMQHEKQKEKIWFKVSWIH